MRLIQALYFLNLLVSKTGNQEWMMSVKKYGKYLTSECILAPPKFEGYNSISTSHIKNFGGGYLTIHCNYIMYPHNMLTVPHDHDYPLYYNFFSANPNDVKDFDAEIDIALGEEREEYKIQYPTIVYIPAGLLHGPVKFVKVTKPVLFIRIALTGAGNGKSGL